MNPSILFTIFEKAKILEAQGKDLIKLHLGQPDQFTSSLITKSLKSALDQGMTQYGPYTGHPNLIKAIAKKHHCQSASVLVGPGSKWLIHAALKQLITPKKPNVILFNPTFSAYQLMINDLNGQAIPINTNLKQGWLPDVAKLKQKLDPKTAVIILTSPNNPTSTIIKPDILNEIHQLVQKHKIPILHDWAYLDLSFKHQPLPKLKSNHLHIFSFSKGYSMTGFRLGFILAHPNFINSLKKQIQISLTCVPLFIQEAGLTALTQCSKFPKKLSKIYQKRAKLAQNILKKADLDFVFPKAGFYLFIDIKQDAEKFCQKLLKKGVITIPGTAFGPFPNFIRISLTQPNVKLKQGLKIIIKSL